MYFYSCCGCAKYIEKHQTNRPSEIQWAPKWHTKASKWRQNVDISRKPSRLCWRPETRSICWCILVALWFAFGTILIPIGFPFDIVHAEHLAPATWFCQYLVLKWSPSPASIQRCRRSPRRYKGTQNWLSGARMLPKTSFGGNSVLDDLTKRPRHQCYLCSMKFEFL